MGDNLENDSSFPLTDVDRWVLSQTDQEFKKHNWNDLKEIIGKSLVLYQIPYCAVLGSSVSQSWLTRDLETNNLSVLKRKPSDLRRYMKWTAETKTQYGSMTNYLLAHRLPKAWGEPPFTPASTTPFKDPSDYCVLVNDWPYGLDPEITHIVVWLRTAIPTEPDTGDMTPESRALVQEFVKSYFVDTLGLDGENQVLWFKNWVALQSVRALEHVHVLVRNVDVETIERWTGERPPPKN